MCEHFINFDFHSKSILPLCITFQRLHYAPSITLMCARQFLSLQLQCAAAVSAQLHQLRRTASQQRASKCCCRYIYRTVSDLAALPNERSMLDHSTNLAWWLPAQLAHEYSVWLTSHYSYVTFGKALPNNL